jgi:Transposase
MTTVEVITSVERRRRWSRKEKLRIVAESAQPGRTTSQVARDHGIAPGQLFIWRRQLLSEAIASGVVGDGFAAVEIASGAAASAWFGDERRTSDRDKLPLKSFRIFVDPSPNDHFPTRDEPHYAMRLLLTAAPAAARAAVTIKHARQGGP